jgi:hypothetical protein
MADSTTHASAVVQGVKTEQLLSTPELLNLDVDAKETSTAMSSWEPNARRDFLAESCLQSAVAVAVANDVVHQLNSDEEEAPPMRTDVRVEEKKRSFNRRRNRGNGLDLTWTGYVAMPKEASFQLAGLDPPHVSTVAHGAKTEQLLSTPELHHLEAVAKETFTALSSWEPNARRDFLSESCLQSAVAVAVANDIVHQLNSDEEEAPQMRTDVRAQEKKRSNNRRRFRVNGPDLTRSVYVAMSE